jgi:hypothetical protein
LTSLAKYFIRAIAGQDIIISLTYCRRTQIPIDTWLDEECSQQPDRFMAYTGTMMPILADLCGLAEDIQNEKSTRNMFSNPLAISESLETTIAYLASNNRIGQRATELCERIKEWRPMSNPKFSFQFLQNLSLSRAVLPGSRLAISTSAPTSGRKRNCSRHHGPQHGS